MTANALVEDRARCLAAGMDDYVAKPIDFQILNNVLQRWIKTPQLPPPQSTSTAVLKRAPAIDSSRLAQLHGLAAPDGSPLTQTIINTFASHSPTLLSGLREAADHGNTHQLQAIAHEAKGAAANIGAPRVAALCLQIEHLANTPGRSGIPDLVEELDEEFKQALSALKAMERSRPATATRHGPQ
jgi:HPt (histidine-containing phosphotransfer) domain-containing protein